MRRLTLRVRNSEFREDYKQSFPLPVTIGRAGDNRVLLNERDAEASRYHAEIFGEGSRLYLRDRSLNGTRVGSRTVHDETVQINPGDEIGISGYRISVSVPALFTLRHTDRTGRPLTSFDLPSQGGVVAAWTGRGFVFEEVGSQQDMERRYGAASECLFFHMKGDAPTLAVVSNRGRIDIRINDQPVSGAKASLSSRDVIKAAGERFDLVMQGEEVLVCGNCYQLVPYVVQGQCEFCGHDLTSAHTCLVKT